MAVTPIKIACASAAMEKRRCELIAQPLSRIWDELAAAGLAAAEKLDDWKENQRKSE